MSELNNHIQQLVELQRLDDDIHEQEELRDNAPLEIKELRTEFEALDARRNTAMDKMAHLQEQKKRLTSEIDDDSAKIKKSKNKMMQVGNSREYNAVIREMDNMERSNRTREEERLTLLEALEEHEADLSGIEAEHAEKKKNLEAREACLDEIMAVAADRLAVMEKKRAVFSMEIPKPIFRRYEFIRKRLDHPVIVPVTDGICSGCNIAIPPQTYIDLQQAGTQILSCPNCQRLIYWKERFEDSDDGQAGEEAQKERESGLPDGADAEETGEEES